MKRQRYGILKTPAVLFNFLILLLCVREVYDQSDGKCYHENGIQRNRKVTE